MMGDQSWKKHKMPKEGGLKVLQKNTAWRDLRLLLWKVVKLMQNWQILCPPLLLEDLQSYITIIREMARSPARLMNGTS